MWMKAQQLWLSSRGEIVGGLVLLLVLLLLAGLLRRRRRRRERADGPLRVLFPARVSPSRPPPPLPGPAPAPDAMEIPDWLKADDAAPVITTPAPAADARGPGAITATVAPAMPAPPPARSMPLAAQNLQTDAAPQPIAAPPAAIASLPDWKTDPGKGAIPLNLRGPATAALTINGATVAPPVPASGTIDPARSPPPSKAAEADFVRARALLGQDRPREALALLAPLLVAGAGAETWAVAGWCHWKLANDEGHAQSAPDAARAFGRAIDADPTRALPLARMIGRCHLLQAATDAPERRAAHVGEAVRVFEAHFVGASRRGAELSDTPSRADRVPV